MTWGHWYWPYCLAAVALLILGPEIYALITNVQNSLSYWIWRQLGIVTGHEKAWTAAHFLSLGVWLTVTIWLTGHFFWRRWT